MVTHSLPRDKASIELPALLFSAYSYWTAGSRTLRRRWNEHHRRSGKPP